MNWEAVSAVSQALGTIARLPCLPVLISGIAEQPQPC